MNFAVAAAAAFQLAAILGVEDLSAASAFPRV